ncbi:MAG: nucleotidyltransferase [Myxococcales bacterium]|nr:nucleotidyltransferase [Myxococcales bacterium]
MTTVTQAMHIFVTSLELSESKRQAAQDQWKALDDNLKRELTVRQSFLSGSYGRHTAIAPLNDIDLFLVLEPTKYPKLIDDSPTTALTLVKDAMTRKYPTAKPAILQNRSVHIEFSGTGIAYDVVPALPDEEKEETYWIPDRDTSRWITTNPRIHSEKSTEANKRAGDMAKPLVKVLKHWKNVTSIDIRSFHLEWMVYDALASKPASYLSGLVTIFQHLKDRVLSSFPDPAGHGSNIDNNLTDNRRHDLSMKFAQAESDLSSARQRAEDGKTEDAHYFLRQMFGAEYPEKGTAPKSNAGSVVSAVSVDNPRNRFG